MTEKGFRRSSNGSLTHKNDTKNAYRRFAGISGEEEDHSKYTREALSNFLILRNVFRDLNANDLEACCHVNRLWKFVADPLLIRYDVKLIRVHVKNDSSLDPFDKEDHVVLKQRRIHNNNDTEEVKYVTKDAQKILLGASKSGKMVIHLVISDYGHAENFDGFVSRFGRFVLSCSPEGSQMTVNELCKRLLRDFPNLQELDTSKYFFYPGCDLFNSSIPENRLKFLRKINVKGFELKNYESLATILKIGPNLEEIHNFPILLSDSLIVTKKGSLVKSVQYHVGERQELNEDTFATALEKLASHASLRTLTILQSESFDFQNIPPMTALEEITIMFSDVLAVTSPNGSSLLGDRKSKAVSQSWPDLEYLIIKVDCLYDPSGVQRFQYRTLDAAFTGIPDHIVSELKDPQSREKFSQEDLQNFKDVSTIRKLSKLKVLKIDGSQPHLDSKALNRLSTLTPLSYEFGFKFLPDLRFIVGTRKHFEIQSVQEIKALLEPLMTFEVERGHY
ncbi:unnamed protein product [Allacma fusca]|uniref:F-box domain-containing protein n=1 Tax=Allacma fusca TaxID=39272 RepID=A0A8J2K3F1_9HEXA|nr:unnamed protein product [Allacma fusca]